MNNQYQCIKCDSINAQKSATDLRSISITQQNSALHYEKNMIIPSTGICIIFLIIFHWIVPYFLRFYKANRAHLNSIAGGTALGSIFLHFLPDIMSEAQHLKHIFKNPLFQDDSFIYLFIFSFILSDFLFSYSFEKMARHHKLSENQVEALIYYLCLNNFACCLFSTAFAIPFYARANSYLILPKPGIM